MSAWSAFFSMKMLILTPSMSMHSALASLPSIRTLSTASRLNSSEISRLESSTWDENRAYSTIFSGSLRSIVAEVVLRSM